MPTRIKRRPRLGVLPIPTRKLSWELGLPACGREADSQLACDVFLIQLKSYNLLAGSAINRNNWVVPTTMVSVEDRSLRGGGSNLKQQIWNAARDTISEWTGQELTECSLYGIRVYKTGSVLATHVDRLPLVSSAIINVASDVDEPWPLEVYGHDGKAVNVTMEPGDMVLYESHSVLHGVSFISLFSAELMGNFC